MKPYIDRDRDVEVVFERNTQRITVEKHADSVQINKEWRRTTEGDWMVSKGISVPKDNVHTLVEILQQS